ncbi:hypothetical protein J3U66_04205 [Gilliamella sp. B2969]|uniref:hypothetical protein n=1 Tax=unclassified Gilliamella TaxID=2685620 RepID=UPI00226A8D28|nr:MULTISPECIES: hypothetical protein [unclassified Gilliamella]MCX8713301.1 hypothetical protein [Gilliamella sp. B3468]MCX8729575.1 hypothetical protein [Gilliamella sp. B2969]MCX8752354.1 hypothetical protein [Gilliamella sp. B3464]
MSGLAIKVSNVDWNKNNLGSVNYGSDNGNNINRITTVSEKAYAIYEDYITKSERPDSQCLLLLINDLVKEGLDQKCKGLFYLASKHQNTNHIKYSIIGSNRLDLTYDQPQILINGIRSNVKSVVIFDHNKYNLGTVDSNLCLVFVMSEASSSGIDWGGEEAISHPHAFISSGLGKYMEGSLLRWDNDSISRDEDKQENDGVYVIHVNKKSLVYKHKNVTINKQLSAQSMAKFCPRLMAYSTIDDSPSEGVMKLYATFSREDLTASDINKIHEIFTKYEHLL